MAIKQILEVGADTGGYVPIQISKRGTAGIRLQQGAEEYGAPPECIEVTWDQLRHLIAALGEFLTWAQSVGAGKGGEAREAILDEEEAAEAACRETALKNGHTVEESDDCDNMDVGCPDCPWGSK